ncbi:MAG: hypothetical protein ACRCY4_02455 [Brevinema sp.]
MDSTKTVKDAVVKMWNKVFGDHEKRLLKIELDGFSETQYKELRRLIREELKKGDSLENVRMEVKAGALEIRGKGVSEGFWWAVIVSAVGAVIAKALIEKI